MVTTEQIDKCIEVAKRYGVIRKIMHKNIVLTGIAVLAAVLVMLSCSPGEGPFVRDNPLDPEGGNWNPPVVTAMADTAVNINDSISVTATGTDNGSVVKYVWAKNGVAYTDTTVAGVLKVAFADSGRKVVRVKVLDDDGLWSVVDSCVITVTLGAPSVTAMADASVNINDSISVTATGTDNGSVVKYVWAKNGVAYTDTTVAGVLKVAFADSGRKVVRVKVLDDDGLWSVVDSCIVTVTLGAPILTLIHDTTVSFSATDSVQVTAAATDANASGSIVRYLWDIGADGVWDDSAATGARTIKSAAGGPVVVRWGARDDDGVVTADTFTVIFNRPPSAPTVTAPTAYTAWKSFSNQTGKGTLPVVLSATDPDGAVDTLTYTLYTGSTAGALTQKYTGRIAGCDLTNIDSAATLYWRLAVRDRYGDTVSASGSFVAPPPPPAGMKLIAAGTFQMGATVNSNEQPVHSVTLSAFWMDSTEVTQPDYLALMGVNPSYFPGVTKGPAEQMTWFDAALYCNKRSKRDGKDTVYKYTGITGTAGNGSTALAGLVIDTSKNGYRLPTEAQWEYACRAGTTTDYYWGGASADLYSWYASNSGSTTHPVASKLPNTWGLYDMSGNVWEWCQDWYGTYVSGVQSDPQGVSSGSNRVIRGGCWIRDATYLRSARRYYDFPYYRYYYVGFRVCLPSR